MRRTLTMKIRVSEEEAAALEARCPDGLSRSAWLRQLGLGQPVVPRRRRAPPPSVDPELLLELRRIGVNLNQLARVMNVARWRGLDNELIGQVGGFLQTCSKLLEALRQAHSR